MKILVCVKQIINLETDIKISPEDRWVKIEPSTDFIFNRFDEYAVEEAVLIKEKFTHTTIDILSVGPDRVISTIKRLQGMGADHGIHIKTDSEGYISPFVVSKWIAAVAKEKSYDLILTGVMSEDEMQGQVGPMLAAFLNRPCTTAVIGQQITEDGNAVRVEREIESGYKDIIEIKLPAVLTIQSGINEPRYPTLTNMLRAKKEKIETIEAASLVPVAPPLSLEEIGYPEKLRSGTVLTGSPEDKAAALITILNERNIISLS